VADAPPEDEGVADALADDEGEVDPPPVEEGVEDAPPDEGAMLIGVNSKRWSAPFIRDSCTPGANFCVDRSPRRVSSRGTGRDELDSSMILRENEVPPIRRSRLPRSRLARVYSRQRMDRPRQVALPTGHRRHIDPGVLRQRDVWWLRRAYESDLGAAMPETDPKSAGPPNATGSHARHLSG
jgi:hypothetical protein